MLIKRVVSQFRAQDWIALCSELVIVVLGIFVAIQVDRWWEHQDDLQQEQLFVGRLISDAEHDVEEIEYSITLAEYRLSLSNLLIAAALDPGHVRDKPAMFMTAVHQSAFTNTPSLRSDTFEELRSTGGLSLLRSADLKSALFEYYRYDETMRQYLSLQLMTEFRHFQLAAGILSNEQDVWMQDEMGYVSPTTKLQVKFSEAQLSALVESADRLKNSAELVAWLPEGRSMQLELIDTHRRRLSHAESLLAILRASE
jgi:hypothetical protein